jgi:type IV pilus assembly protein PilA
MKTFKRASILIVALLSGCSPHTATETPESSISPDQLVVKNDELLYERGADEPFTGGVVERYAGVALRSSIAIIDGVRTGTATWWYESGQKQSEETIVDGKPSALTSWYASGQMKSRRTYVNGQVQEDQSWDENGVERTMRPEIEAALNSSAGAKAAVVEYYYDRDELPADNATAGINEASQISNQYVTAVAIENGVISISLGGDAGDDFSGRVLVLTPKLNRGSVSWQCSSPDIDTATLPEICK